MKNLLLLVTLILISTGGYLQAQCPVSVAISADSNCLFLNWSPEFDGVPKPIAILANGQQYFISDTIENRFHYSISVNDTLANCDTAGITGFTGTITFDNFGGSFECEYEGGEDIPECPDNVLVSESENCLIFMLQPEFDGTLPDSVTFNDTSYFNQGYNKNNPKELIFLKDTVTECDTSEMNTMLLTDTLRIGQKVCTYTEGLLPITILAFDYQNDNDQVTLSWKVNSDEPTRKLYLQKSYDGVDWMNVYEQNLENFATGQIMNGQYKDGSIEQPRLYYRLYIAGYHQEVKYSNILPVTMKDQVINTLFYQSNSRSIMIKAGQNFTGEMQLINAQGQNMMTKKVQMMKNSYHEIDVEGHLTPGIYFVKFDNGLIPPTKIFIDN